MNPLLRSRIYSHGSACSKSRPRRTASTPAGVLSAPHCPATHLPAKPDEEFHDSCERCAAETCSDVRDDCLEDDDCIDQLRCQAKCRDPACLVDCRMGHARSPWHEDYWNCVFEQCASECNTGGNWACVDDYDWPPAETSSFEVRFVFVPSPYHWLFGGRPFVLSNTTGATVRACAEAEECTKYELHDTSEVRVDFTAELELVVGNMPRDFRGYIELDGPDVMAVGERQRLHPLPLARAGEYRLGFVPDTNLGYTNELIQMGGAPIDFERPRLATYVRDCLLSPAPGVHISVVEEPEATTLYHVASLQLLPGDQTTPTATAVIPNLPDAAQRLTLRATHAGTGDVLAERGAWVRPGWTTFVELAPAAHLEL